ncbi:MAG: radical SAM family heme chaperone HemW [Pseudomonadota bacterium]
MTPEPWREAGFGLYIHWPYCQAKCPYCDFNSHVVAKIDQEQWATAYLAELDRTARETEGRILDTVFFGGGTPSLMDPKLIDQIMDRIRRNWSLANNFEATMEANPSSVEADRFAAYRLAGIDRVSLGIQALNDPDLKALGRLHSASEARAALEIAQSTFNRVSFDLIYARQNQTPEDWKAELTQALTYGTDHLSLYQLTIEDGTAFGDRFALGKLRGLPDEDHAADMYEITQALTEATGLPAYEVSNHAKPGQESRHNLIYWRGGDYIGIGPGAHGRLTLGTDRIATETELQPLAWLQKVSQDGSGETLRSEIDAEAQLSEYLMMALRTREGAQVKRLPKPFLEKYNNKIKYLVDLDLLEKAEETIKVPPQKRILLNAILKELLT